MPRFLGRFTAVLALVAGAAPAAPVPPRAAAAADDAPPTAPALAATDCEPFLAEPPLLLPLFAVLEACTGAAAAGASPLFTATEVIFDLDFTKKGQLNTKFLLTQLM